tara:strand:- start:62 stop:1198 length:1137 start_codon:yes stop_codon:yes gene_type:complete
MTTPTGSSITDPKEHFNTLLYAGNGATSGHQITGLEFQPDFVWIKNRSSTYDHHLYDSIRGSGKWIESNDTVAEQTGTHMDGFLQNGFSVGNGVASSRTNLNGHNYVGWCWKAGGSSDAYNIDGVGYATAAAAGLDGGTKNPTGASVNTKAGFSIISYVASNGTNDTIYHGLKQAPEMIITKDRDNDRGWGVYYTSNGTNTNWARFDSTNAQGTNDSGETLGGVSGSYMYLHEDYFQPAHGSYANGGDDGSDNLIAYMWHSVPGYSKMGLYTGNNNSNGPYIPLGFRPAWIMLKRIDSSTGAHWLILDNKRSPTNVVNRNLYGNLNNDDGTADRCDFLANGIKLRQNGTTLNVSGTYIYMAFAEQPGDTPYMASTNAK